MTDWTAAIWQTNGAGPAVPPTSGNTYALVFNGVGIGNSQANTRIRTPAGGVQTFPGNLLTLNTNTELRLKNIGTTANFPGLGGNPGLILNGGMINVGESSILALAGTMQAAPGSISYLCPGNNDIGGFDSTRGLGLLAQVSGSGTLVFLEAPTNTPQTISGNSNTFSGTWVVKSGYLLATGTNALGTNSVIVVDPNYSLPANLVDSSIVNQGLLEVSMDVKSLGTLTLTNGGLMNLHQSCAFAAVTVEGVALSAGTHSYAELTNRFPANFLSGGSGSLTVSTSSTDAPTIITQPLPQNQFAGGSVIFSVSAAGTTPLSYQWQKGASNLVDMGNVSGSTNASLIIRNVSTADVANYDVIVTNAAGSVTSSVVALSIITNVPESGPATQIQYLSGTDKDHTVPWNFIVSSGRNSGTATNIPVPSCWETMGFGTYNYGNNGAVVTSETGTYTYTFSVPSGWAGKEIFLVFEGVFTDTSASINGQSVGLTHQGGFYEFSYDITTNVVVGATTNVLQVVVNRWSANSSIIAAEESGDYWDFSGIFRPVYLEAKPSAYIGRIAANPQPNGQITVSAYLAGISTNYTVNAFVTDSNHVPLGTAFSAPVSAGMTNVTLSALLPTPSPWSAEFPTLYTLTVQLVDASNNIVHTVTNQIGFRTVAFVSGQGFFINGTKIVMRGICHHEEWPTTGRTSSLAQSDLDLALIRDMNFNTLRMTHYPPSKTFLNECDRLGFYVLDELTGWANAYDTPTAVRLVKEMVVRDVNHPSVITWDNGNEGGWNTSVDNSGPGATNVYAIWDPQQRKVLRPQSSFNSIRDDHYPSYSGFTNNLGAGKTAYMCTEVLHGLYDGGGGAGLLEFWNAMRAASNGIGMFEWVFADSGQARADQGGIMDVKGQNAPDGVTGPYREKEASYYTYKSVYNPVQVGSPNLAAFNGMLAISNRYDFTSLSQCTFDWQLGFFPDAADPANAYSTNALTGGFLAGLDSGNFSGPVLPAQTTGTLVLPSFPSGWTNYDALRLTATDPYGNNLYTWTWPLRTGSQIRDRIMGAVSAGVSAFSVGTNPSEVIVTNGIREFHFSATSGIINSLKVSGQPVSFSNGPQPVAGSAWAVTSITNYSDGTNYIILVNDLTNAANGFQWTLLPNGWLKLSYRYTLTGSQNFMGITFDYPTNQVTALNWLGQGPYRVYKDRSAGQEIFTHTKAYNFTWTGQSTNYAATSPSPGTPTTTQWIYPEFEGYHGRLCWATLLTTEQPITVTTPATNLFFRVLTPPNSDNHNVNPAYPPGTLSFLDGISPQGEKFNPAQNLGPAGQLNAAAGLYTGELNFYFGPLPPLPEAPMALNAHAETSQVFLSWAAVSGATGYNLKSSTVSGGPYSVIAGNLTSTTFTNTGLSNGIVYYYVVSAVNGNGEGKDSPQVSALPLSRPAFGSISLLGTNLIIGGANGTAGMKYQVLTSTNLLSPVQNWAVMATNIFNSAGAFQFTNPVSSSNLQQYFILKLP